MICVYHKLNISQYIYIYIYILYIYMCVCPLKLPYLIAYKQHLLSIAKVTCHQSRPRPPNDLRDPRRWQPHEVPRGFKTPYCFRGNDWITPLKTKECPLKSDHFSREYIFQLSIFKGHVSFQGSTHRIHVYIYIYGILIPRVTIHINYSCRIWPK